MAERLSGVSVSPYRRLSQTNCSLLSRSRERSQDWRWNPTYSGAPQGGIVSPILSNVYLHAFDLFMEEMGRAFTRGMKRKDFTPYHTISTRCRRLRKRVHAALEHGDDTTARKWKQEIL